MELLFGRFMTVSTCEISGWKLAGKVNSLSSRPTMSSDRFSFDDVDNIYSGRIATCSSMVKRPHLRLNAQVEPQTVRLLEAKTLINMCRMARTHNVLQKSLTSSVSLSEMVAPCRSIGVEIQAIANLEAANVLWEQGETTPAIGMLQSMLDISGKDPKYLRQTIPITRPELLSKTVSRFNTTLYRSISNCT